LKWIKCSERLPELDKDVLTYDGNIVSIAELCDTNTYRISISSSKNEDYKNLAWLNGSTFDDFEDSYITHWSELPEGPQDEQSSESQQV